MNDQLPKPAHAREETEPNPYTEFGISAMTFNEEEIGNYRVEWTFREPRKDVIFHFYKRKGLGGNFPASFRDKLWAGFTQGFDLVDKEQHRVNIDWVGEADSWCVCVVLDGMIPPGEDVISATLKSIMS